MESTTVMERQMLDDIIVENLNIVFVGTAVGKESAKKKAYYAHSGNSFWKMLYKFKLTNEQFKPEDYKKLHTLKIGLTDIVKDRVGADKDIEKYFKDHREKYINKFTEKIREYAPKIAVFNGKKAARWFYGKKIINYGEQDSPIEKTDTIVYVLPSTSAAARRWMDEEKWKELAQKVRRIK